MELTYKLAYGTITMTITGRIKSSQGFGIDVELVDIKTHSDGQAVDVSLVTGAMDYFEDQWINIQSELRSFYLSQGMKQDNEDNFEEEEHEY